MKSKNLILEATRIVSIDGEDTTLSSKELFVVTDDIINVFTKNERLIDNEVVCEMHFILKSCNDIGWKDSNLMVLCTLPQAHSNMYIIKDVLDEFANKNSQEDSNTGKHLTTIK